MTDKIEQFRRMAESDPDNELAHFSLGKALCDARRFEEAVEPLRRTVELNPSQSRAYQLLGSAFNRLGRKAEAIETLRRGYETADARGDILPRDVMGKLLEALGEEPPAARSVGPGVQAATDDTAGFRCRRCNATRGHLSKPPFNGPLGRTVQQQICGNCWSEWVGMGTKVINELRLRLSNPQSQQVYDQHMIEFLGLDPADGSATRPDA